MGCDIHGFVEIKPKATSPDKDYPQGWDLFWHEHLWRDYNLFSLLAGVRNYEDKMSVLYPPRGVPDDLSCDVLNHYGLMVNDQFGRDEKSDHFVTKAKADSWVSQGWSRYWTNQDPHDTCVVVTHPDWHTASWLRCEELGDVLRSYLEITNRQPNRVIRLVHATMKAAERMDLDTRFIFWFDN